MIRVIIADDEEHARTRLGSMLGRYPEIDIVHEIADGDELVSVLESAAIDVAFLDINMPGTSVFKTISALSDPPFVVFQTAYSEYAVKAFGIDALDYLMKPVSRNRLDVCISKIKKALAIKDKDTAPRQLTQISVKYGSIMKVIKVADIFAVRTEDGFSYIHTAEGRFMSDKSLNYFDEILADLGFFRVSRTAIVNLDYVKVLHPMFKGSYSLELVNGVKLPVSRRRMKNLRQLLKFL